MLNYRLLRHYIDYNLRLPSNFTRLDYFSRLINILIKHLDLSIFIAININILFND